MPRGGFAEPADGGFNQIKVTGKVQTPWFGREVGMNVAWRFLLDENNKIYFVAMICWLLLPNYSNLVRTDVFSRSHRGLQLAALIIHWLLSLDFTLSIDLNLSGILTADNDPGPAESFSAPDCSSLPMTRARKPGSRSFRPEPIIGTLCLFLYADCVISPAGEIIHPPPCWQPIRFSSTRTVCNRMVLSTHVDCTLACIWLVYYKLAELANPEPLCNLLVFVCLILSSLQLFIVGTWLPHNDNSTECGTSSPKSLRLHPLLSFAACYHFGYHLEHHRSPSTPWFQLPEKHYSMCLASCKSELLSATS